MCSTCCRNAIQLDYGSGPRPFLPKKGHAVVQLVLEHSGISLDSRPGTLQARRRNLSINVRLVMPDGISGVGLATVLAESFSLEISNSLDEACDLEALSVVDACVFHADFLELLKERYAYVIGAKPSVLVGPQFDDIRFTEAARLGFSSFISETESTCDDVGAAVQAAVRGQSFLPPELAVSLLQSLREKPAKEITARQLQILDLVILGKTDDEIGQELFLSRHSVKKYVKTILERLEARNRTQAAIKAVSYGLCKLPYALGSTLQNQPPPSGRLAAAGGDTLKSPS